VFFLLRIDQDMYFRKQLSENIKKINKNEHIKLLITSLIALGVQLFEFRI